jgi:hypothetical protein
MFFYTFFIQSVCVFFCAKCIYLKTLENYYINNIRISLYNTIIKNIGKLLYS